MKRDYVVDRSRAECKRLRTDSIVGLSILILLLLGSVAAYATVPAVIGTAASSLGSDWGNTNKIVMDRAGNVYTYDPGNNRILKIPADGSPRVSIPAWGGSMGLTVDASGNLYYCTLWGANVKRVLYLGGGAYAAPTDWLNIYDATGSYWFPTSDITYVSSDATNDYFVIASFTTEIYQVARNRTSGKFSGGLIGKVENAYNGNTVAADSKGNVFALDANSLWEIPAGTSSVNKIVTGFNKAVGISVDGADNVLVSDGNANAVILIPNENGTLNPAKKFTLYSGTVIASALLDKSGLLVPGWGSVNAVSFSGGSTPAKPVGQASDPLTITYLFTADVTPTFSFVSQGVATTEFSDSGTGTCVPNTAYTAGQTCTLNVTTTAAAAGSRSGAVLLSNSGKVVSQFYVSGIGLGGGLLVDPGTQSSMADVSNFSTPQAVALDGVGNLYVADTGKSEVLMLPAGGGTPESVGTGLNKPAGVAVDGAGSVFISNTVTVDKTDVGQVLVVPNQGGTLKTSDQFVIATGLAANPSGVAIDRFGSVFVADTGNKQVLKLTKNFMGSYVASVVGSGYKNPVSVTTDAAGNVFVGDGTEGVVYGIRADNGAQYFVVTGLGFAGGLATDASGSIYVADSVNKVVSRIPLQNGVFFPNGVTWIGSGFVTPKAVAIDAAGNAYIADAGAPGAFQVLRGKGLIDFGQFNIGIQSDTYISKLYNYGTQPLTISPFADLTGDFNTTQNACSTAIDPGKNCTLSTYFKPTASGPLTATLSIASDGGAIQQIYKGEGVALAGSTITIAMTTPASGNPGFGSPVTFSATVAASSGSSVPTGKVVFAIDGTLQAPVTLASGRATFTTASMTGGKHNVTATYTGDASFASSVTAPPALEVNVQPAAATVTVYATSTTYGVRNTYNIKDTATVTATVTAPIKTIPTGTVAFFAGSTPLGIGVVSSGVASTTIPVGKLVEGTYQLKAVYNEDNSDTNFAMATSPVVNLVVTPDPTFTLTSDVASATVKPGQTGVFHITLSPQYNFQDAVTLNPGDPEHPEDTTKLNCQGLLPQTACLFTLTGNGSSSQSIGTATASYVNGAFPSITLQLTTVGPGNGSPSAMTTRHSSVFLAMLVPGFLGILSLAGARKNRICKVVGIALVLFAFAFLMAGCSASNSNLPAKVAPSTGTPAGSTTVTVVATSTSSGSVSPSVTQTMQFQFTVVN